MSEVITTILKPPTILKIAKELLAIELFAGFLVALIVQEPFVALCTTVLLHFYNMFITNKEPHIGCMILIFFAEQLEKIGIKKIGYPTIRTLFLYKTKERAYYES